MVLRAIERLLYSESGLSAARLLRVCQRPKAGIAKLPYPTIWRGIERTIRDLLCLPGSQAWWEIRKHWYTDVFQSLVADLIARGDAEAMFEKYDVEELQNNLE